MSLKYGVRDVRNLPGSDEAVCDKILFASAHSETEMIESGFKLDKRNPSQMLSIAQLFKNGANFFGQKHMNLSRI